VAVAAYEVATLQPYVNAFAYLFIRARVASSSPFRPPAPSRPDHGSKAGGAKTSRRRRARVQGLSGIVWDVGSRSAKLTKAAPVRHGALRTRGGVVSCLHGTHVTVCRATSQRPGLLVSEKIQFSADGVFAAPCTFIFS